MSIDTNASIRVDLSWTQTDTQGGNTVINDAGRVLMSDTWSTGVGPYGNVNTAFYISDTLDAYETGVFDLYNLERTVLGGTLDVSFSGGTVRGFILENGSTGTNPFDAIEIRTTGTDAWSLPWSIAPGGAVVDVAAGGAEIKINRVMGFPVSSTYRYVTIYNRSALEVDYELAIIGQTPWSM